MSPLHILIGVAAALTIIWIIILVRFMADYGQWKTKQDFSFDELDKILGSDDYKYQVNKYLHKYRSDRRWYENRLVRGIVLLSVVLLAIFGTVLTLFLRHFS